MLPQRFLPGWSVVAGYLVGPGADLANANLARANLTGADFAGANLTNANLTAANLTNAKLDKVILAGGDAHRRRVGQRIGHTDVAPDWMGGVRWLSSRPWIKYLWSQLRGTGPYR